MIIIRLQIKPLIDWGFDLKSGNDLIVWALKPLDRNFNRIFGEKTFKFLENGGENVYEPLSKSFRSKAHARSINKNLNQYPHFSHYACIVTPRQSTLFPIIVWALS